jgi:hypothetical protein
MMRTTVLMLSFLLWAVSCWAAGDHRGRDLAVRGMRIEAHHRPNRRASYRGWDLVAQGLAVLLSQPGEWERDRATVTADIRWFLKSCARQAGLPKTYMIDDIGTTVHDDGSEYEMWWPVIDSSRHRYAILVEIPYQDERDVAPTLPACQMLIGKLDGRIIASAVRDLRKSFEEALWGLFREVADLGCWVSKGHLWAVLAGCYTAAGTGTIPSAVLLRDEGTHWSIVSRVDWPNWERLASFTLGDVDHDGVPEVVGSFLGEETIPPFDRVNRNYTVYKLRGQRYVKIWDVSLESLPAQLGRFRWGVCDGNKKLALASTTSPQVVEQARRLGLWKQDLWWEITERHDDLPKPYVIATIGDDRYRLDLVKLSRRRWRISGISRAK